MGIREMVRRSVGLTNDSELDRIESKLFWNQREPIEKANPDQSKTHYEDALSVLGEDAPPEILRELAALERKRLASKSETGLVIKSNEAESFEAGPSLLLKSCGLSDVKPTLSTNAICRKSVGLGGTRKPNYWQPQVVSIAEAVRR